MEGMNMPKAETASDSSAEHAGIVMGADTTGTGSAQSGATTIVMERSDTETIVIGIVIATLILTGGVLVLVGTRTRTAG